MPDNATIVNAWAADRLFSGPLTRDTEAYNQVVEALSDLIARLDGPKSVPISAPSKSTPKNIDSPPKTDA